jgi:type II secretory pathway pseudopilin PulG
MKKRKSGWVVVALMAAFVAPGFAQKFDYARMERDIKVAENILKTMIKQQYEQQRMFFPLEIKGSYQQGFGVTFRIPADYTTPIPLGFPGDWNEVILLDGQAPESFAFSMSSPNQSRDTDERVRAAQGRAQAAQERAQVAQERSSRAQATVVRNQANIDSLRNVNNEKIILSAKDFMVDYGDLLSQLPSSERIVITNQGEQPRAWVNQFFTSAKRTHLSVEIVKADIVAHKQGKLSRDQAMAKISVVKSETSNTVEPDLELLSSIFNRLYRSDIATTFFTDEGIYYERLKDFGAVYYMKVYSSNQNRSAELFSMPTAKVNDVDQATRDKKVKEMYPTFEKELKENILEYGRTVKSLGSTEALVFNVKVTKCTGCGIPSSLELSVKGNVLKDYASGKITRDAALSKMEVRKGQNQ